MPGGRGLGLPRQTREHRTIVVVASHVATQVGDMGLARINILLVDDQPAKLLSYEAILEELGENLLKASSAKQALELLLKREIAVILIDVCMPDLDGFELAR